jgi:RNA polymerase sigma factor (sigma-70 family)
MMTARTMSAAIRNDAELVDESLSGNRDAFGQIVSRYQSLICSLAYSATGSLSQSEDLAQDTFVTAWKQLADLREPAKLRSWLCGIARNIVNNSLRRQGREPSHAAETLEAIAEPHASGPSPVEHVISREEEAILWRSLEQIPEIYREPLILFYREHQSVEIVAANLELTEDAVKQRLSRGRKLLQEQVLAFVEGALARTNPGQAFTLGVLAALPAMTISVKAATIGVAAKGSAAAKGAGLIGLGGAMLAPLLGFYGMWEDYRMKKKAGHSARELKPLKIYYTAIAASIVAEVLACCAVMYYGGALIKTNPSLFVALMLGLILGYPLALAAFARRIFRDAKKLAAEQTPVEIAAKPRGPVWEYRSRFELLGLPFIHIRFGGWFGRRLDRLKAKPVKAWIAVTDTRAVGALFAYGSSAIAPIGVGACAIGLFSFGAFSLGAFAVGGFGFGMWALAPFAFGWQAFGDCAIAWNAAWGGQYAIAHHFAIGETAYAAQANNEFVQHLLKSNSFFQFCTAKMTFARMILIIWVWAISILISQIVQGWVVGSKNKQKANQGI